MLDETSIIAKTENAVSAVPILKGGSDRAYWRVTREDGSTLVVMEYTTARADNASFVPVTRYLASIGVAVPAILKVTEGEMLVWLQDLGGSDLWEFRDAPWQERRDLYRKTLREVAKLHAVTETPTIDLQPPFDEKLYGWEQGYFLDEYVAGHCGEKDVADALRGSADFVQLNSDLVKQPRALLHRDFQSQNVMVKGGGVFLIDYQGLRFGVPEYDVASLLFDPYVKLTEAERLALQHDYCEIRGVKDFESWQSLLHRCAAQRLMQALGAYGYIGNKLGKKHFLVHIPPALVNLRGVLQASGLLPELLKFL
jgi:aminoglycoside/choline kinase family phosphotransferase